MFFHRKYLSFSYNQSGVICLLHACTRLSEHANLPLLLCLNKQCFALHHVVLNWPKQICMGNSSGWLNSSVTHSDLLCELGLVEALGH